MVFLIGISGATGSGKSTVVESVLKKFREKNIEIDYIKLDSYFKDIPKIPKFEIGNNTYTNFEIPEALDIDIMYEHLKLLKEGNVVETPIYKKKEYTSKGMGTRRVEPKNIILVEGFLLFADERLRQILDKKIALNVSEDTMLKRRLKRFDAGNYVHNDDYFKKVVLHGFRNVGLPSLKYADHHIDGDKSEEEVMDEILKILIPFQ